MVVDDGRVLRMRVMVTMMAMRRRRRRKEGNQSMCRDRMMSLFIISMYISITMHIFRSSSGGGSSILPMEAAPTRIFIHMAKAEMAAHNIRPRYWES